MSANASQARSTSGRHQRCCCRQCWSKIRCRRCAARKLALRGRPAQERNVEHRAWQDDPASLCARRRLVGCPKNRQKKLIGSRRTARQRHESSSAVVHVVTQKTPVISRTVCHVVHVCGHQVSCSIFSDHAILCDIARAQFRGWPAHAPMSVEPCRMLAFLGAVICRAARVANTATSCRRSTTHNPA